MDYYDQTVGGPGLGSTHYATSNGNRDNLIASDNFVDICGVNFNPDGLTLYFSLPGINNPIRDLHIDKHIPMSNTFPI